MNETEYDAAEKCEVEMQNVALSPQNDLYIFNMPVVYLKILSSVDLKKSRIYYNVRICSRQAAGGIEMIGDF